MARATSNILPILGHQNNRMRPHYHSLRLLTNDYATPLYYIFNSMLLMLLVFHIYWWVLICSTIRRQLKNRGKVGEDIRSNCVKPIQFDKLICRCRGWECTFGTFFCGSR